MHYYKGKLLEASEYPYTRNFTVWEVLDEYADVRDELEELLDGFRNMRNEIETAIYDLEDGLEEVEDHLRCCDRVFRRFKTRRRQEEEDFAAMQQHPVEEEELPFETESS